MTVSMHVIATGDEDARDIARQAVARTGATVHPFSSEVTRC